MSFSSGQEPSVPELGPEDIIRLLRTESGFSSELKACDIFLSCDASPESNLLFIDAESGTSREIDVMASIGATVREQSQKSIWRIKVQFVCDVKSSSAPTVIFTSETMESESWCEFLVTDFFEDNDQPVSCALPWFWISPHHVSPRRFMLPSRLGRVVTKVLSSEERKAKNRIDTSWFRDALFSTIKASRYLCRGFEDDVVADAAMFNNPSITLVSVPLILIDGPLYEFFYESGKENLRRLKWCGFKFPLPRKKPRSEAPRPSQAFYNNLIVFCHIDCLNEFLKHWGEWVHSEGIDLAKEFWEMRKTDKRRFDGWWE